MLIFDTVGSLQGHFQDAAADISQLLQLGVGHLVPFVDSPSHYGKILSTNLSDLIQALN